MSTRELDGGTTAPASAAEIDDDPEADRTAPAPRFIRQALTILWPAFVMAGVLEAMVFAVVDPGSLHWFGAEAFDWPEQAVYSATFLIFWGGISVAGAITSLLQHEPEGPEDPPAGRPGRRWPN